MEDKEVTKKEPTIEQYKQAVEALKSQNNQLIYQLQNANMTNLFKRLDYLFKVIENAAMFDEAFVDQCIAEVKELMTPPNDTENAKDS